MPHPDPDETIAELYRAASGKAPWSSALQRIVDDLGAMGSQMIGVDKRTGGITFSHVSDSTNNEAALEYVRKYHAVDPRVPVLVEKPVGEWLYDQDFITDEQAAENPYYRDLLIPYGGRYTACIKLAETETDLILVGFLGKRESPPFTREQQVYFERIGRHLAEAADIHWRLKGFARSGAVGAALIARIHRPIAVVDKSRRITARNEAFDKLAGDGNVFRGGGGLLLCDDVEVDRDLAQAMETLAVAKPAERRAQVIKLDPKCAPVFALSVAILVPDETLHAFGDTAQYLVMAHHHPTGPQPDVSLWQAAFNLSPAECKVAAHLFSGKPPKEIAKALNVSPSTVKTHLDSLFAKTKTGRQAELVRVLGMVVEG